MFMIRFFYFLFGTVRFSAFGGFIERFIDLCTNAHIPLWDISSRKGVLRATTTAKGYRKVRHPAKKSGVRVRIQKKKGLPFAMHRYRRRIGFAAGIAMFFAVLSFLSLYVWNVEVTGNVEVSDSQILSVLEDLGLRRGALRSAIEPTDLQRRALIEIPDLAWIAVNIKGSSATVEVKERTMPPEQVPKDRPCNIKATREGQIIDIEVYQGTAAVGRGDAVAEGQLLVSGVVENKNGVPTFYHARARIVAQTTRTITTECPLEQTLQFPNGIIIDRRSLNLFGLQIPLFFGDAPTDGFLHSTSVRDLMLGGMTLPLSVQIDRYEGYSQQNITVTEIEAGIEAKNQAMKIIETDLYGVTIKNQVEFIEVKNNTVYYTVELLCEENITMEEEILIN